jgi:thiol:disulfide interchange protein
MTRRLSLRAGFAVLLAAVAAPAPAARHIFDPTQDPAFALARARAVALREHKNLLLDVGGNWCVWCVILDQALHRDPALSRLLTANYVLLHVNVSPENPNRGFMARFPAATGYPFLIILSPDAAKLIHAQNGLEFQNGKTPRDGYDHISVARFLARWAPKSSGRD